MRPVRRFVLSNKIDQLLKLNHTEWCESFFETLIFEQKFRGCLCPVKNKSKYIRLNEIIIYLFGHFIHGHKTNNIHLYTKI